MTGRNNRTNGRLLREGESVMEWIYAKGIPIEAQYLYRKGLEMERLGKTKDAYAYLKQAVVLAPRYGRAFFEMGNCLAKMGRYDEAREKYNRAHQFDCTLSPTTAPKFSVRENTGSSRDQPCSSTVFKN